ncbi:hypothetical protein P4T37_27275 [Bacillus mobilis]|uniref:hypothetical protein n=1 Tax=Bacillus mobilis TaxID=2026190 RepID=UPI002E1B4551|nr:hypothetical protein [Bacillus mobilis]
MEAIVRNKLITLDFFETNIKVDLERLKLKINDMDSLPMDIVYSDRIIDAYLKNNVYIDSTKDEILNYLGNPLYYCSRNILSRKINNSNLYLDFLFYNHEQNIFPNGTINRSLGHNNDVREFEVHQVLSGSIFSIIKLENNELYVGIFKKGDYFEIPPGAFHCSYILEGPAIVANFYCNAYWECDIQSKPYFVNKNDITVEKNGESFVLKTRDSNKNYNFHIDSLTELDNNSLFKPYKELFVSGILKKNYSAEQKNIFKLFNSDILNSNS